MNQHHHPLHPLAAPCSSCSSPSSSDNQPSLSRRALLQSAAFAAAATLAPTAPLPAAAIPSPASSTPLPTGRPLRLKPALSYHFWQKQEKTSWRSYGALQTQAELDQEATRIETELKKLADQADFPIQLLPLDRVANNDQAKQVLAADCDAILLYAAGGSDAVYTIAAAKTPTLMFLRHKSGPHYLWYEIAHWRLLRNNDDTFAQPNMDADDIVVDDYAEILWRLRALYGLKNAKGTKMLAIGGLVAYSQPAQQLGPPCAKNLWNYQIQTISEDDFAKRLQKARDDPAVMKAVEQQAADLLAQPNVTLQTDRRFVVNSFLALNLVKQLLAETGSSNFGFANCMGRSVISMLDTPPCLLLALANDEGYTAYCHTDLSHTFPGVLLRWIANKPTFVCNSHFPHHGIFTVAHCAAPRKMNGKDCEPAAIMTHFESDYGAATKVRYTNGQLVTAIIPNLHCSRWQGFRGRIIDSPNNPACRSQMDIQIDGDWKKLLKTMQGFHTQVCYGDHLREVGYALKKLGTIEWENFSA